MSIVKILGSVAFAIFLITVLVLVLIVSTSLESLYGTPFVQKFFYQTGWFDVLLTLFAVNIFCATLPRLPFKKRHTGFIVTHIGLLCLLLGSVLSRFFGVDGQMMLFEGNSKSEITQSSYELILHRNGGEIERFGLASHAGQRPRKIKTLSDGTEVLINRLWENAVSTYDLEEGKDSDPANHAIVLRLKSERAGANESIRLIENNPADPENSRSVSMGPATIELKEKKESPAAASETSKNLSSPTLKISCKNLSEPFMVDLLKSPKEVSIPQTDLTVQNIQFYPDARVGDQNQLINASNQMLNPAVEFDVTNSKNETAHFVKFTLYPDFESMHAQKKPASLDVTAELLVPNMKEESTPKGPSLTFYYDNGHWSYSAHSSKGEFNGTTIEPGKTYPAGLMDFTFTVEELYNHALVEGRVQHALGMNKGQIGVELALVKNGQTLDKNWILEEPPQSLNTEAGKLIFLVKQKTSELPFTLKLKQFRKIDYPGTNRASAYESDVSLHDEKDHVTIEKTIWMNHPLDYKGYRIFQSSFSQDPEAGNTSIFTIAKNPGVWFIYSGACIMFLGIFLTFFVPPLSTLKH